MFSFYRPISVVFEKDPTNDPNNPDLTGGTPTPKPGGGGGGEPEPKKDELYELVIDGEKRSVTLDEMRTLAQKSGGADKRFQAASDLRKSAEDGLRVKDLIGRLSDKEHQPSTTEIQELATLIGVDPGEFMEYLNEGNALEPTKKDQSPQIDPQTVAAVLKQLGLDPADAKATLDYSKQRHIEDARKEIRKISDEAVDKDDFFGKIKIGEKADDRIAVVREMVAEDVLRKIQDGVPFGADLVAASVQKIRAHLNKFGIPGRPDIDPVVLGLGPGLGLPSEIQADEPIKRKSAAEDGDGENLAARYMQKALKMFRQGRR